MGIGNAVDDAGDPNRVIRPLPTLAAQRDPCLDRAELPHYGPEQIIETYYSRAIRVFCSAVSLFSTESHASTDEKTGYLDRAGLLPQLVPALDLSNQLELTEGGVETKGGSAISPTGGGRRHVENPAAQRPGTLVPFGDRAVGGGPGVAGKVERSGIDDRPVQEIASGIVGVFVGLEYVDDKEPAHRQHQAVGRL